MVVSSNVGTVTSNTWSYTPVLADGGQKITITLTAIDGKGGTVTDTFDISFVEHNNPSISITAMDSYDSTTTRFGIPASPTVIRYGTQSKAVVNNSLVAGTELSYFSDMRENLYITKNSTATVTSIQRAASGVLIITTDNTGAQVGDTIQINCNQFTDETGGVLSGILTMTYNGSVWTPSIQ